jgi:hypothetical protein
VIIKKKWEWLPATILLLHYSAAPRFDAFIKIFKIRNVIPLSRGHEP